MEDILMAWGISSLCNHHLLPTSAMNAWSQTPSQHRCGTVACFNFVSAELEVGPLTASWVWISKVVMISIKNPFHWIIESYFYLLCPFMCPRHSSLGSHMRGLEWKLTYLVFLNLLLLSPLQAGPSDMLLTKHMRSPVSCTSSSRPFSGKVVRGRRRGRKIKERLERCDRAGVAAFHLCMDQERLSWSWKNLLPLSTFCI